MKLAKGSKSWIITTLIFSIMFLAIGIFFNNYTQSYVAILVSILLLLLCIFFIMFFRDPERTTGKGIVAAADGKIREISEIDDSEVGKSIMISTFMNVNNVHVNRACYNGKVISVDHKPGAHLPAFKKESERNERVIIILDTSIGKIKIIQIAGTLARRIIPYIKKGDKINKGDRIGIIRLGSRVDVYISKKVVKKINVKIKDKILAGSDCLAEIND